VSGQKIYDQLMNRARMEIRGIRDMLLDDPEDLAPVICNLAYQAVEKMLKAFLLSRGVEDIQSHDVRELFRNCLAIDAGLAEFQEQIDAISFFVPADEWGCNLGPVEQGQALAAYEQAVEIQGFLIDRIKE
jgi:hypothetical protein